MIVALQAIRQRRTSYRNFFDEHYRFGNGHNYDNASSSDVIEGNGTLSRTFSESSDGSGVDVISYRSAGTYANKHKNADKFCEAWIIGKPCRYGKSCRYAHSIVELNRSQSVPTSAQIRWMMLSQEQDCESHEAILAGRRTKKVVKNLDKNTIKNLATKPDHSTTITFTQSTLEHLIEQMPLVVSSESDDDSINNKKLDFAGVEKLLSKLHNMKVGTKENDTREACDLLTVNGFCPLGNQCFFDHTLHHH